MPPSYKAMQSAMLEGMARFERWRVRWESDFFADLAVDLARQAVDAMTPQQKDVLYEEDPQMYDEVMQRLRKEV